MSNICTYIPSSSIASVTRLNQEFTIIHKALCYLEAVASAGSGITQVTTTNSSSVTFTGLGTVASPLTATASFTETANNGLSVASGNIVLGQTVSQVGSPAALTSNREIPLAGHSIALTDSIGGGYLQTPGVIVTSQVVGGDGIPAGVNQWGRTATVSLNNYATGFYEFSFVTANAGFFGYSGVQSWPYVTGALGGTHGKFSSYIAGFSAGQLWDGSGGAGNNQLGNNISYFSGIQTQTGGVLKAYDLYCSEINSVGGTTLNPVVVNHYALYAEAFTYATNNYGIYINGVQTNYMGGKLGMGQTVPTATIHIKAGTATAGTAPIKLTTGVNLTTVEAGAIEYDGTNFFASQGTTRYTVAKTLTTTAVLDFPSTNAQNSSDLTVALAGSALGDIVELGVPNASVLGNSCFTAWVSIAGTITVRFNNYSSGALDPASGTFRVSVVKYT